MKICIISNLYTPYVLGGAEVYVERIARRLSDIHDTILITTRPYKNFGSLGYSSDIKAKIKVFSFYPLNIYHSFSSRDMPELIKPFWHMFDIWNMHAYISVGRILRKEKPDVVHTHNLSGFSLSAVDIIKRLRLPWVHTCHDFSLLCPYATLSCTFLRDKACRYPILPCNIYRRLKRIAMDSRPGIVIFPSQSSLEIYLKNNFFKNSKREILHYCIEPTEVKFSANKKDDNFNILYVGQLVKHKGVHILIEAFKNILYEKAKLHIVGEGDYERDLRTLAEKDKRIVFYGKVSNTDIWRFYNLADITVIPSLWQEVLGIVILESLAVGTPVVGSDIGGITEIVKNGHNGFIFEAGNSEELKGILKRIIFEPNLLKSLKTNALQSSYRFVISEHISRLEQIYKKAVNL